MSLAMLQRWGEAVRKWFFARTEKDASVLLLIVILAIILRVPFLDHPQETLFDEVVYANFAMHIIDGAPFFDIHPPLARMLFAEVAQLFPFHTGTIPMEVNQPFHDFPYVAVRFFVALFGILLAPLIYAIGRLLGYTPRIALVPALFVVFDNALVLYSRTILPDMLLLVFAFSGFAAAFAATKAKAGWKKWTLVFLAGCALGLAASVKWTALGVVGIVMVVYLLSNMYREMILSALLVALVYVALFAAFVWYFPQGGKADPMLPAYDVPIVTQLEFPREHSPQKLAAFLLAHHRVMLETNRDPDIAQKIIRAPGPLAWPAARSSISFWKNDENGKTIILMGNSLLWLVACFALLFELFWIAGRLLRDRRFPIDRTEGILIAGYLMNYLPFFFIHRPMYLYHYFTALLFLFLLLPRTLPRIIDCIIRVSGDRPLAYTLVSFVGFLIIVNFFLLAPTTYGF